MTDIVDAYKFFGSVKLRRQTLNARDRNFEIFKSHYNLASFYFFFRSKVELAGKRFRTTASVKIKALIQKSLQSAMKLYAAGSDLGFSRGGISKKMQTFCRPFFRSTNLIF